MELLTSKVAFANAMSGAVADSVSTLVLYPLDAIKVQMQADSSNNLAVIIEHTFEHGLGHVYKGLGSKLAQGIQQKFQYFYMYALMKDVYLKRTGQKPSTVVDLLFGYLAAFQGLGTTLPLEVTNTRIITHKKESKDHKTPGFFEMFREQWNEEGFLSFYRTIGASAILCINPAITYVVFEEIKSWVLKRRNAPIGDVLTTLEAFMVGVFSKSLATIITFPFIRCKVLMNVWKKKQEKLAKEGKPTHKSHQPTMMEIFQHILETEGVKGFYVGLEPQLVKGVSNAALMLTIKEKLYAITMKAVLGADQPLKKSK